MRHYSHLNTAVAIIKAYEGQEPLAAFLKKFFAADKKYGSGDRKSISSLCYAYYRLGKTASADPVEEQVIKAVFLCHDQPLAFLEALRPGWNANIHLPVKEKWVYCGMGGSFDDIFPCGNDCSEGINAEAFCLSFLQQPDLFLRVRPGKKNVVEKKLSSAGIPYRWANENALALANTSKIGDVLQLNREAVVQDLNSQAVLNGLQPYKATLPNPLRAWDCCAASGGKSILLHDTLNNTIELTVSDIRQSILANLSKRFAEAGIPGYRSYMADLSGNDLSSLPGGTYDLIICDAPCTGSGTWARTPEQLYFFDQSAIENFTTLQKRISANVIPSLAKGGFFIYITCSVFRAENEEVAAAILQENPSLEYLSGGLLTGYTQKADSMFTAMFRKA